MQSRNLIVSVVVAAAAVAASFVFSAAPVQADTYVDLSIEITAGTSFVFTARNNGTGTAYDVTVDIEFADVARFSSNRDDWKILSGTSCSDNIPGTTCVNTVWTVGRLGPGDEATLTVGPRLASGLPCCSDLNARQTVPARAVIKSTLPGEEERFKGDNTAVGWISVKKSSGSGEYASQGGYWLEASVDDLLPEAGDTVNFSFEFNYIFSTKYIRDVKVRLKLDDGMGTPAASTSTLPTGTTFDAAQGLTRTWDWNIGTPTTRPLNVVVSTTLDDPLPTGAARSDLCLTAELTARPDNPDNSGVSGRDTYTSAEICFKEDPVVLLQTGRTGLFTCYPCVGVTTYPCTDADTLEVGVSGGEAARRAGIRRDEAVMNPERVVVHVPDPNARHVDGSSLTWRTLAGGAEGGVTIVENYDRIDSDFWNSFAEQVTATDADGGVKPGTMQVCSAPDCDTTYADADAGDYADSYDPEPSYTADAIAEFGELGTYVVMRSTRGTHTNNTATTSDDVMYETTARYTFHVGPIAELEVWDGGANPGLPLDRRAFTIVAVNNGPEDAPAVRVTVTGLSASDYVSHTATKGTFTASSTAWVWDIGELNEPGFQQDIYRRDGEVLTIITSAAADTEVTAAITNTRDYQVCIDSDGNDVDLPSPSETACKPSATSTNTWHTAKYFDHISDNNTATSTAKAGSGAELPNLQAADPHTAAISLEWDAVDSVLNWPVTHYEVRASDPPCVLPGPGETGTEVFGTTYVDVDVEPGDEKCYHVRAVNMQMVAGPWSSALKGMVEMEEEPITATAGAPDKPVLNAAPNEGNRREEILVSWTKPIENGSPIVSYTLEVSDTGRDGSWSDSGATLGADATSWVHTMLTGGTRKFYRLRASNMCDSEDPQMECHSEWSDAVSATTDPPGQSGPPTGVSATRDGDSAIDVSWHAPLDDGGTPITRYEVQWSADGSTTTTWHNAGVTPDGDTLTFKHTGLTFMTTRYYRVAARNSRGLSVWSGPPYTSATTLAGVPGQPNLTARATDGRTIELTWTTPPDNGSAIVRFELEWSPDGSANSWVRLTNTSDTDTSYDDSGLDPGTERHYRIRAVNDASPGEGSWSTTRSAKTPPEAPDAPSLRVTANGENAIDLTWEPPSYDGGEDVSGYEIHVSKDGAEKSYSRLTSLGALARSYTHSGLQPGDERYYQVRARNSAGWGEFSQPTYGRTLTGVPRAPGLTARANGSTELKLSWTKPDDRGSDITGYELQESDDGSEWSPLDYLPDSESEYVHTGLTGGTTKHYRIRAVNGNGGGEWSQTRSARTDAGGPDAPVLTLTAVDDNTIKLDWTEPANNGSSIRGYWVERSVDGDEPWERLTSNNRTTTYSDTTLYRGMTRYYRVAAFNSAGTGPYSGVESEKTTGTPATVPEPPALLRLSSMGRNEVTIAWDPPEDDGGAPMSRYEYEVARPCDEDPTVTCDFTGDDITETTVTSARIAGLSVDGDYYFRVRAINPVGKGEWNSDLRATLRPSTNALVRVSPTEIRVNEGDIISYTISLGTAPPHPVNVWIQPRGPYNEIEEGAFGFNGSLLVPNGWVDPDPKRALQRADFTYNWSQGVRVTFTAPEDGDADNEIALMDHFVAPLAYDHYRPCRQETQAERDQCRQDWEDAWADSPYEYLTGANVIVRVRDND